MPRLSVRFFGCLLCLNAIAAPAAAGIIFDLSSDYRGKTQVIETAGGVTLTLNNFVDTDNGNTIQNMDGDGIPIGNVEGTYPPLVTFDITFSEDVEISRYYLGYVGSQMTSGDFQLVGANGTSGLNTMLDEDVWLDFDAGTIPVFQANQTYSFSNTSDYYAQLQQLEVTTPVPAPPATLLIGSALLLWARARKDRI